MYKMYKINNTAKKILTFDHLCVIFKITIKVVSLGVLRPCAGNLITTHLVHKCVVMTLSVILFRAELPVDAGRLRRCDGGSEDRRPISVMMSRQPARVG